MTQEAFVVQHFFFMAFCMCECTELPVIQVVAAGRIGPGSC